MVANTLMDTLYGMGLIPVIKVDDAEDAVPLCKALCDGGLPIAEITFRTKAAPEAIRRVSREIPHMLVGAGTVTSVDIAKQARDCGATFAVTPGFNPEVVRWCLDNALPVLPGCTTASEVEAAQNLGLRVVKFFPAEQSGGLARIKALSGPYPEMRYIPTGGIGTHNLTEYLDYPKIVACGGSFMVTDALVREKNWAGIADITRKAMDTVVGLHLKRIHLPADAALQTALSPLFSQTSGLLLGENTQPCATYGVHSVDRAHFQFRQRGAVFDESSAQHGKDGKLVRIALAQRVHGLTICFERKDA